MPQGFVLFVNDLPECIQHFKIVMYADAQMQLFVDKSVDNFKKNIEADLLNTYARFTKNMSHLNVGKTKCMLYINCHQMLM